MTDETHNGQDDGPDPDHPALLPQDLWDEVEEYRAYLQDTDQAVANVSTEEDPA